MTYLVIDQLVAFEAAAADRRYTLPVLQAFPSHWQLIYTGPDSGSKIYRRVKDSAGEIDLEVSPGLKTARIAPRRARVTLPGTRKTGRGQESDKGSH